MDTGEIDAIIKQYVSTTHYYKGVFNPKVILRELQLRKPGSVFVVNTSPLPNNEIQHLHWVAMYVLDENELEFFDSFGKWPEFYGGYVALFADSFRECNWNDHCFQGNESQVCGGYCCYFAIHRCSYGSLQSLIDEMKEKGINDNWMHESLSKEPALRPDSIFRRPLILGQDRTRGA
uniref:ADP-dependent glucokinase n=1 Tax=Parasteatoda tepidariorum TaxID=114398 RepID=A0A2L2Y5M3_PARTP